MIAESTKKPVVAGVTIDELDYDYDIREGWAVEYVGFDKPGVEDNVYIKVEYTFDVNDFDFEWEPDGAPTYVPYGSQMVLYDSGKGGLESVNAPMSPDDTKIIIEKNNSEEEIDIKRFSEIFGLSDKDAADAIQVGRAVATEHISDLIAEKIADDPDYWPDRDDYWPEPDYDRD